MRQGSKTNYNSNNKLNFVKHLETSKNQSDVKHSRLVGLEFDRTQTENIEGQQHKHQVKNNQLKKWWHQCSHLDVKVMQTIQAGTSSPHYSNDIGPAWFLSATNQTQKSLHATHCAAEILRLRL